jgi:hypothetical protein
MCTFFNMIKYLHNNIITTREFKQLYVTLILFLHVLLIVHKDIVTFFPLCFHPLKCSKNSSQKLWHIDPNVDQKMWTECHSQEQRG